MDKDQLKDLLRQTLLRHVEEAIDGVVENVSSRENLEGTNYLQALDLAEVGRRKELVSKINDELDEAGLAEFFELEPHHIQEYAKYY